MITIDKQLLKIKQEKKLGLMTHVIVGYPTLKETEQIVLAMADVGVDFIELQIPFSDPLADGPTIMKACEDSLRNGTKVADAFILMKKLSARIKVPLLFMAYYNTVFRYGVEKFCRDAVKAGAAGVIVPDMPLEEEGEEGFLDCCNNYNLANIRVVSPASTRERLEKNAQVATGFVYATARQGTTDAKKILDPQIATYLKEVKQTFRVPMAVGFGISTKTRIDMIRDVADVVVVGSGVIDIIRESAVKDRVKNIKQFIKGLGV